ncbi:unnamed protein product [Prunus armeniaca]|uniref:Uncharacterized protein n=1 Tax=Prunus armeniaca TaxID=36596 RepID=A0A6J5Y458_PRUAR|nr:unnamed protein product [Prunus armeniaca]
MEQTGRGAVSGGDRALSELGGKRGPAIKMCWHCTTHGKKSGYSKRESKGKGQESKQEKCLGTCSSQGGGEERNTDEADLRCQRDEGELQGKEGSARWCTTEGKEGKGRDGWGLKRGGRKGEDYGDAKRGGRGC